MKNGVKNKMKGITAKIKGIKYMPLLCRELHHFSFEDLDKALEKDATFILEIDKKNRIALSWWVSAKRTRSYPYARIYDSLSFTGKKVTIIPVIKDEGQEGDRDFLQWDTISLMSLLGVYVIVGYYKDAIKSTQYENKITEQRFNIPYIKNQINKLLSYQSDALHWNLSQIDDIAEIGRTALQSYDKISKRLSIEFHDKKSAENRINELKKGKEAFMALSRTLAEKAQKRESATIQPKEKLDGTKTTITIRNYLGGNYYFTSDEIQLWDDKLSIIDAKHTKENKLPSLGDIKDGLLKMILFTNLEDVKLGDKKVKPIPVLKLTTGNKFNIKNIKGSEKRLFNLLNRESEANKFRIVINDN